MTRLKWIIIFQILIFTLASSAYVFAQQEDHSDYKDLPFTECNECHLSSGVAPSHQAGWLKDHRVRATKGESFCNTCHTQSFCQDCHTGGGTDRDLHTSDFRSSYVPKSHRNDWRELHPIDAARDPNSCERCHDAKFCSDCHAKVPKSELQALSHRTGWSTIEAVPGTPHANFSTAQCATCHPNGALPVRNWTNGHKREARRGLKRCQACHPQGNVCLTCHSARTGLKINPHPGQWNDIKGNIDGVTDGATCRKCH